jgi:ABC-2 type transport system permease protein
LAGAGGENDGNEQAEYEGNMSRMMVIAGREVRSLFVSLNPYVVLCLFLLFMSLVFILPFTRIFQPEGPIEMRNLTNWSRFGLFFVVPLLTMSMFADEYKSGRIEMLRTSPITEFDLLAGKFIGAMTYYMALVGSTLFYLLILIALRDPNSGGLDYGKVASCYLGMVLMGCMFVAIGLFFSACTSEQIIAGLLGMLTLGVLTIANAAAQYLPEEWSLIGLKIKIRGIFEYMTVGKHIGDFAQGWVELSGVVYFLGFAGLFLFCTYVVLESKKWR